MTFTVGAHRLSQYLLGAMPEAERASLEELMFADDDFYAEVATAVDDLVLAYLGNRLSAADRQRFESHFLSVQRHRERLGLMRDLLAITATPRPRAVIRWSIAAALILVVGAWGAWRVRTSAPEQPEVAAGPTVLPPTAAPASPTAAVTVLPRATPPRQRVRLPAAEGGTVAIAVAATTATIALEMPLERTRHPTFAAVLRDAADHEVWRNDRLLPGDPGEPLRISIPADLLRAKRYALVIEGEPLRGTTGAERFSRRYTIDVARPLSQRR